MTLSFVIFKDHNTLMANLLSQDHHIETQEFHLDIRRDCLPLFTNIK